MTSKKRLIEQGIEAHSFFSEELFENEKAQIAMTILNLIVNKHDRVALRCWLGYGSSSANVSGYENLMNYCQANNVEPFEAVQQLCDGNITIKYSKNIVTRFNELLELLNKYKDKKVSEIVAELFPKNEVWTYPFLELLTELDDEEHDISDIQNEIHNNVINPEMPLDVDYVRIMSIHKSKGLTSEISIICGVIEGSLPRLDNDLQGKEATRFMEEQRRLFFVGITRPKKELVVSSVSRILKTFAYTMGVKVPWDLGKSTKAIASSFLSQMGQDFPDAISSEN